MTNPTIEFLGSLIPIVIYITVFLTIALSIFGLRVEVGIREPEGKIILPIGKFYFALFCALAALYLTYKWVITFSIFPAVGAITIAFVAFYSYRTAVKETKLN